MERRGFLGAIAAVGVAGGVPARATEAVTIPLKVGSLHALIVKPARPNGAGVLLQPTIAAIDAYMRSVASELAGAGYTVVIWDPYRGESAPVGTAAQLARSKRVTDADAMQDLRLAVDHMLGPLRMRSVATIGWCLGGRFALVQGGQEARLAAVVAYNPTIYSVAPVALYGIPTSRADFPGQTMNEFALAARIACPVQVMRPEDDLAQPAEYERLGKVLFARRAATQVHYFPGAAHGFSYKPEVPANRAATRLAWPATLALLKAMRG